MKHLFVTMAVAAAVLLVSCGDKGIDLSGMSEDDALKVLDEKIHRHPKQAYLYFERGKLLLNKGKANNDRKFITDAISDLNYAIQHSDAPCEYYTALGDAYFSSGNVSDSYAAMQKALQKDSSNNEALLKMGEIAYYSKDYDRSMEMLSKVTEKDKNNLTALYMKGFIYKENNDTANAVFYFRKVIDLYPDYEPAYEELGTLYAERKNGLAVEYLNTALRLQPRNVNVLYGLAKFYQDIEEADKAIDLYVKILEIDPGYKYAWFNRGWIELVLYEDYASAVEFFTKAIECDANYTEAYYNRGVAYEFMGEKDKARQCYDETLRIDPDYTKLQNK